MKRWGEGCWGRWRGVGKRGGGKQAREEERDFGGEGLKWVIRFEERALHRGQPLQILRLRWL